ncbi:MAG: hypothetical protein ACTHU0_22515 [Kofleriaceae bacterium]
MTRTPRRRSLASRLIAVNVLQFVLFIAAAIAIFIAQGPRDEADPRAHIQPAVVARLEQLVDDPPALDRALEQHEAKRIEVSKY